MLYLLYLQTIQEEDNISSKSNESIKDLLKANREIKISRNLLSHENALLKDQRTKLELNITLLSEKQSMQEIELNKVKKQVEKCRNELAREREISGQLMSAKVIFDSAQIHKENLTTCLHKTIFENGQLFLNMSVMKENILRLKSELQKASEDKVKFETANADKERLIVRQNESISNLKNQTVELYKRNSLLEEKFNLSQIEFKKNFSAVEEEKQLLIKEMHEFLLQKKQKESPFQGMILSGENGRVQMYSLESRKHVNQFNGVTGVTAIEIVSNDLLIASFSDYSINIFSLSRNTLINTLIGHVSLVVSYALISDITVASGSLDSDIRIWNIENGKCLRVLIHLKNNPIFALQPLSNRRLASATEQGTIKIWNLDTGALLRDFSVGAAIYSLALLPNERLACSRAELIQIYDTVNFNCLINLRGHTSTVYALLALPGSNALVSASTDNTIKKWDLDTATCKETNIKIMHGHTSHVFSLALVSNNTIASASFDNTIRLWDIESGNCTLTIPGVSFVSRSPERSFNCLKFASLK